VGDYEANFTARSLVTRQFVDNIIKRYENLDVDSGSPVIIAEFPVATYTGFFIDYVIKKGLNVRAGTLVATHDGTNVVFNETMTQDLGNTSEVELSISILSGNITLLATTATNDWVIKTLVRGI
jgi:hypothetical protein